MNGRLNGRRLASEQGFTLIEMLIAALVMAVGVLATITTFSSSKAVSLVAQRHEVAVHQAQKKLEDLNTLSYAELAFPSGQQPAVANRIETSSTKIGFFDGSGTMVVRSAGAQAALSESFASASGGQVPVAPQSFTLTGSSITGKVYSYVTYRRESCGTNSAGVAICPGTQQTKRITVGITLTANGRRALEQPVWVSSVITKPGDLPYVP